jgi:hypothetical protein
MYLVKFTPPPVTFLPVFPHPTSAVGVELSQNSYRESFIVNKSCKNMSMDKKRLECKILNSYLTLLNLTMPFEFVPGP